MEVKAAFAPLIHEACKRAFLYHSRGYNPMADRETELQELFTALSQIRLDDLDSVEKAVVARRDYLIHCALLALPIGAEVRWEDPVDSGDTHTGKLVNHNKKSVLVMHESTNGYTTVEGELFPHVTVHYDQIIWDN